MCNDVQGLSRDSEECHWVLCPICGSKTRIRIRRDTELSNFPLFCPKCKRETIISVKDMKVVICTGEENNRVKR